MKTIILTCLIFLISINSFSQEVKYGINEKNGRYTNTGDAKIYYEVYGEGKPVVLLHGGFGYIDGYKDYIKVLSKKYKVIAIATRGYGKSEIGSRNFSYSLFAEDVKTIIQTEGKDKAIIMGFSDGAMISYLVAINYPEVVERVVAMGGPLGTSGYTESGLGWLPTFNSAQLEQYRPDFKKIMPEPERWDELIENLKLLWSESEIAKLNELQKIECPVLLMYGDRDIFCRPDHIVEIYKHIPNAQLAIFPNSTHVNVSQSNMQLFENYILGFIGY